jgi:predicted nucleic acid-binding protein
VPSGAGNAPVANQSTTYVLDSFALLAYLQGEVGRPVVRERLAGAAAGQYALHLSLINLGEIMYIVERERGLVAAQRTLAAVDNLPLQVAPVSRSLVLAAAHIKAHYRLAYADAFAIATAQQHAAVLITGDPELRPAAKACQIEVEWLARH